MSIFDSQYVRSKLGLSWGEDYVLGLIASTAPTTYSRIGAVAVKHKAMSNVSAYKYVHILMDKKLITKSVDAEDKRLKEYTLTEKGKKMIKELQDAVK
jgi:DNA-binding MarR family transcriptional regulator